MPPPSFLILMYANVHVHLFDSLLRMKKPLNIGTNLLQMISMKTESFRKNVTNELLEICVRNWRLQHWSNHDFDDSQLAMSRSIKNQTGLNAIVFNRQDPLLLCSYMSQWCFLQSEWGCVLYFHFALSARSHFLAPWRDKQVLLLLLLLLRSHATFDLKWSSVGDAGIQHVLLT